METLGLLIAVVCAIAALTVLYWFWPSTTRLRFMRGVPVILTVEVSPESPGRLVGSLSSDAPLVAPVSGTPCIYWRVVVQERTNDRWQTVRDESAACDFWLTDELGRAYISKEDAQNMWISRTASWTSLRDVSTSSRWKNALARFPFSMPSELGEAFRAKEVAVPLHPRTALVCKTHRIREAGSVASAGGGYRDVALPERIIARPVSDGRILLSQKASLTVTRHATADDSQQT